MLSPSNDLQHAMPARRPGLVCRVWRGWTTRENAPAYAVYLNEELFPRLVAELTPRGYRGHQLITREHDDECEFVALTWFASLESVTSFAGADYLRANVSPKARSLLARYEEYAAHYTLNSERL